MNGRLLGIVTFPGLAREIAGARRYVRALLSRNGHCFAADDAELLVSECVTNAIRFTLSGADGGRVTVKVCELDDAVRIEVLDQGGTSARPTPRGIPNVPTDVEDGRGLHLVKALAKEWGTLSYGPGSVVWFTVGGQA